MKFLAKSQMLPESPLSLLDHLIEVGKLKKQIFGENQKHSRMNYRMKKQKHWEEFQKVEEGDNWGKDDCCHF